MSTFVISLTIGPNENVERVIGLHAICQIKSIMKTGKLVFGWAMLVSFFVAVGTLFSPRKAGYRVRRILERGERLIGVQGGMIR